MAHDQRPAFSCPRDGDPGRGQVRQREQPGDDLYVSNVKMDFSYSRAFDRPAPEAYERLFRELAG